jgi:protoheme IX farnesyltransferase
MNSRWPHRFALALAFATLALIFIGGLVTSTNSGLSVPDWPLSYGRLMPPMIGGIFYEHGHRMVATAIGFFTILLAVLLHRKESRPWVKKAGWTALGLVIAQGLLGGMTVLLRLPPAVSIFHACTAQTFLSLITAIAVWTSQSWGNPTARTETSSRIPFHHLTTGLFGALYIQLILGAVVRHTGMGLTLHIAGAVVAIILIGWIFTRAVQDRAQSPQIFHLAACVLAAALLQAALGISTYFILGHEFPVIPPPFWSVLVITSHVMGGALVLGLSVALALFTYRTRPENSALLKTKISDYFELTKPGISIMAGITALAGFIMGAKGHVNFLSLFHTGLGTLFVASGACTLNMVFEKDIDARMRRTQKRPIPAGRLHAGEALFVGTLLSGVGVIYLALLVNGLTAVLSSLTLSIYLYIYTPLKKKTSLCTGAGAVAGALPPVMGWTAATGHLGFEGWVLFGILFFWQFPHFFSLAWLYKDDYSGVGLRMLPVDPARFGSAPAKEGTLAGISMLVNSVLLLGISLLPAFYQWTGWIYGSTALALGAWMVAASALFLFERSIRRARQVFFASILYIPLLLAVMVLNK